MLPGLELAVPITAGNYSANEQWIPPIRVLHEVVLPSVCNGAVVPASGSAGEIQAGIRRGPLAWLPLGGNDIRRALTPPARRARRPPCRSSSSSPSSRSCAYAAILLAAYLGQRRLMYFPDRAHTLPAEVGLMDVEERVLKTPDGARVITWYGKARPGKPTLLYFHGNAGSLAVRAERIRRFMDEGWGVCMMSYRGYSGSKGSPI